jgi:glyoxylase-like metal-dependent hydrolase (beta-lactamase superfamily II)
MLHHESSQGFSVLSFAVGPLGCNCSLVWDPQTREAVLVDPGGDAPLIQSKIDEHQLKVAAILHTHAHFDHIGASDAMAESTLAPLHLHEGDQPLWDHLPEQGQRYGISFPSQKSVPHGLDHEQSFQIGRFQLKTLFTPGHTPGSCSFCVGDVVIAGDTLFRGSVGRTDLWGGDFSQIRQSIRERLYSLDPKTLVITGHGPTTQIGIEQRQNAFVRL